MTDVLLIAPSSKGIYQDLSKDFSARETNIWAGLLANSVRAIGRGAEIIDLETPGPVEGVWTVSAFVSAVEAIKPKFVLFVVTGQNPNASSAAMSDAVKCAELLAGKFKIGFVGPHVNALPVETLEKHAFIDFVLTNEGVYALRELVKGGINDLADINGVAYYDSSGYIRLNPPSPIVPMDKLEQDLPGVAYDLMPSLDNYRTSHWHTNYDDNRSPFASIYTSLGCPMQCSFCMINIINRTDNSPSKAAADFNVFRHWSPEFLIKQFDYLAAQGVKHIKIADELFVLRPRHFMGLCDLLIERDHGFNIWAYSRIDTVKPQYLEKLKAAGVNWLALGIESANQEIRREITKGKFEDINIREVVSMIEDAGIQVMANYIVGNGNETWDTMQQTLDLATELNTAAMNVYAATALPGSPLYLQDKQAGLQLPKEYSEFGFLSFDHVPSRSPSLTSAEILSFRDYFWTTYHTNPRFLNRVDGLFGQVAVDNIKRMTEVSLRRRLI